MKSFYRQDSLGRERKRILKVERELIPETSRDQLQEFDSVKELFVHEYNICFMINNKIIL